MKAITTTFSGPKNTRGSRIIARDSDGNKGYLYALTDALGVILLEREWKETGKPVRTGEHYNHAHALVWGKETE